MPASRTHAPRSHYFCQSLILLSTFWRFPSAGTKLRRDTAALNVKEQGKVENTMAKTYYDHDADLTLIQAKKVAIIGYGSQGQSHSLTLKDSGVQVKVGLAANSKSIAKAQKAGLEVDTVPNVTKWADVVMVLVPDQTAAKLYAEEIAPNLSAGKLLL